ncbi:MAG: lysophospholipid acyltransferase family protein [Bacteroidales bacterium]|nr:lysophospholipid acyltransferase family protein [Bacteroidales bacterium]
MIYRATHHFFIYPFFQFYSLWKIKRHFRKVSLIGEFTDKNLPVLLVTNHFSWWDGFWAMYINLKLFHRKFYFMMLEDQLIKHMFFNKTGGYSIKKGSKSIVETIDYTVSLLSDGKNLVMLFPQGEITSMHISSVIFEKGIEHIMKKINSKIHLVFLVNMVDYFSDPKLLLNMYFTEYKGLDYSTETLQEEYNRFYSECISKNLMIKDT